MQSVSVEFSGCGAFRGLEFHLSGRGWQKMPWALGAPGAHRERPPVVRRDEAQEWGAAPWGRGLLPQPVPAAPQATRVPEEAPRRTLGTLASCRLSSRPRTLCDGPSAAFLQVTRPEQPRVKDPAGEAATREVAARGWWGGSCQSSTAQGHMGLGEWPWAFTVALQATCRGSSLGPWVPADSGVGGTCGVTEVGRACLSTWPSQR